MPNMLRDRRGSVAFATVIALVPLIGFMALGAEAGSWYVTKQQAQSAADAAAYSGGLLLECTTVQAAGGAPCNDTHTADYRARQLAAQNFFCDGSDTNSYPGSRCSTSLPSGTTHAVSTTVSANQVQVTVSQTQPAYLAKLLGLSTVTIGATATAQVDTLALPCVLSLHDPLAFQGATTVKTQNGCGMSSNDTVDGSNSVQFTGNAVDISQVASISSVAGCSQTGGTQCSKVVTFAAATPNPLSGLDTAISSLTTADFPDGACPPPSTNTPLPAYGSPNKCYYDLSSKTKGAFTGFTSTTYTLNGIYFFADGALTVQGSSVITTTPPAAAALILLPPNFVSKSDKGASLSIAGNPTIQITGPSSVTASQVPTPLGTTANLKLLAGIVIYDPENPGKNKSVNISGSSTSYFSGITYAPNADVTYQGNTQSNTCNEVIAYGITLSGSSTFNNSSCPASSTAITHYVHLVQ